MWVTKHRHTLRGAQILKVDPRVVSMCVARYTLHFDFELSAIFLIYYLHSRLFVSLLRLDLNDKTHNRFLKAVKCFSSEIKIDITIAYNKINVSAKDTWFPKC